MKNDLFPYRLYLVTDEAACMGRDLFSVVEDAVKGGVDLVQLREKQLGGDAFLARAKRMKDLLDKYSVPLIINDNLWVAMASESFGIHVGNSDMHPVAVREQWSACGLLGYSIEYEYQLDSEDALTSDYLALSPVFSTPTKINTVTEWKEEGVARLRKLTTKPLVAIGGIHINNAAGLIKAGADCLAVVSAVCSAEEPRAAAAHLRNEIEKAL